MPQVISHYSAIERLPGFGSTSRVYHTDLHGVRPSNSGATNTANMQILENLVNTAGGGVVVFGAGTYNFADAGNNPFAGSRGHCIVRKSNVQWLGRAAGTTVLQLADGQHTSARPMDLFVFDNASNISFRHMSIRGNRAGQASGTFGQSAFGNLIASYVTANRNTNVVFEDLVLTNAWSNVLAAINCDNIRIRNVYTDDHGEGPQIIRCKDVLIENVSSRDTTGVCIADMFEIIACERVYCYGVTSLGHDPNAVVPGSVGFDVSYSKDVFVSGLLVRDFSVGFQFNPTTPQAGVPTSISARIENAVIENTFQATQISSSADYPQNLRISNMRIVGGPASVNTGGNPSIGIMTLVSIANTLFNGHFSLDNVSVTGHEYGALLATGKTYVLSDCEFSGNSIDGLRINLGTSAMGSTAGSLRIEADGLKCCNNGQFGVYVFPQTELFDPVGFIRGYFRNNTGSSSFRVGAQVYNDAGRATSATQWQVTNTAGPKTNHPVTSLVSAGGEHQILLNSGGAQLMYGGTHGQIVHLVATASCTITHASGSGADFSFVLIGAANFSATAGDIITLRYNATTKLWTEIARFDP